MVHVEVRLCQNSAAAVEMAYWAHTWSEPGMAGMGERGRDSKADWHSGARVGTLALVR
jgi:hypothetical protein